MKVIITGTTGYVGEGVMLCLLRNPKVEKVLSVSRRPTGVHQGLYPSLSQEQVNKLEEYIIDDFLTLKPTDEHFAGYDAVFFIAGITSVGTPKDIYKRISYDIPAHFADVMPQKDKMTYIYLSGAGTNPQGKQWWMPIKGATEQYIRTLGFRHAFAYRPAMMNWAEGQRHIQTMQYPFIVFYPITRLLGLANKMQEVADSMLEATRSGYKQTVINPRDITRLARQWNEYDKNHNKL